MNAAITADSLSGQRHSNARVARLLALAELYNEHWVEAFDAAQRALALKDEPAWPRLIMAIAAARLGRMGEARGHLDAAIAAVPVEFGGVSRRITVEKGHLWFESRDELERLRETAERLLTPV